MKDSPAVFVFGAALTAALASAILYLLNFGTSALAAAVISAVAIWLVAWIGSASAREARGPERQAA